MLFSSDFGVLFGRWDVLNPFIEPCNKIPLLMSAKCEKIPLLMFTKCDKTIP